jgi:pyruvate ferredoxin oxidoreductase gamma subunit/2-oxoisovalerate ferredoxin oxidoreductase gamma subunit
MGTKEASMRELRFHGRGGQGAVIASKLLASALFLEGRSVQSFPAFGVERRGAPVVAYLRVSDGPILLRCEVTEPDDLVVLDPTLIGAVDVTAGLKPGGTILINSEHRPSHYAELGARFRVATVDASAIARRHGLGSKTQPIVNTAILGALAISTGLVSLDAVCRAIEGEVPQHSAQNIAAARAAATEVRLTPATQAGAEAAPQSGPRILIGAGNREVRHG